MKLLLLITVLFTGLVAGLLYSYSCSVNPAFKNLEDGAYIKAMQAINTAIQNAMFFIPFMGLLVLLPLASWQLHRVQSPAWIFFGIATGIYIIGVFGVTVFFNVRLNERLARFFVSEESISAARDMRLLFENTWGFYHSIRTVAAVLAFASSIAGLFNLKTIV